MEEERVDHVMEIEEEEEEEREREVDNEVVDPKRLKESKRPGTSKGKLM